MGLDLPFHPPTISDSQKSQVTRAEADAASTFDPAPAQPLVVEEVCAAFGPGGPGPLAVRRGAEVTAYRRGRPLDLRDGATLPELLHHVAHHATHPVFPPHGVEWAAEFLAQLERWLGPAYSAAYRNAFEEHGVHFTPEPRISMSRKRAKFSVNKEHGVLCRIVVDDPPEDLIVQLLSVDAGGFLVVDDHGERYLPNDRLRYFSRRFKDE